jgi:hypothetical protein
MKRAVALFGLLPVAIFFEASGIVRDALIDVGVNAVSVDLRETERPGPHIVGDVFEWLDAGWAGAIMHPTCTFMCGSGLHWNARDPRRNLMTEYWLNRVRMLMRAPIPRWAIENPRGAIENPRGVIGTQIRPADQMIQPWQFGDDASKETHLWLKGLSPLAIYPEWRCAGRVVRDPNTGKWTERWSNQTDSGQNKLAPSDDRWAQRSETYPGVSREMARQWAPLFALPAPRDLFGEVA